jgi:hypothetical protein
VGFDTRICTITLLQTIYVISEYYFWYDQTSHQGQNQYPQGFPPLYSNHGCLAQPASTFAHQAPTSAHQAPTSSPQSSLEDTLNTFIKSNG